MTVYHVEFKEQELLLTVFAGDVSDEELMGHARFLNETRLTPGFRELADTRRVSLRFPATVEGVEDAAQLDPRRGAVGESRIAVVVAADITHGMSRMYAAHIAPELHVFRSLEEAVDWLGVREIIDRIESTLADLAYETPH